MPADAPDRTGRVGSSRSRLSDCKLVFEHDDRLYGIAAHLVAGLVEAGPVRHVPGAPPEILGLSEWRGNVLTVIDLPRLAGLTGPDLPRRFLRMSEPLDWMALSVPAEIRFTPSRRNQTRDGEIERDPDGNTIHPVDVAAAILRLEDRMRGCA